MKYKVHLQKKKKALAYKLPRDMNYTFFSFPQNIVCTSIVGSNLYFVSILWAPGISPGQAHCKLHPLLR